MFSNPIFHLDANIISRFYWLNRISVDFHSLNLLFEIRMGTNDVNGISYFKLTIGYFYCSYAYIGKEMLNHANLFFNHIQITDQ